MLIEQDTNKKTEKSVPRAWLFDCDGPLTDPAQKKMITDGLAENIASIIDGDDVVAVNTGRSISWLFEHGVVNAIEKRVQNKKMLEDVILVGEKGGTLATYENGEWATHIDESIKVPETLQDEIRKLVEDEFSDCMFFDESKLTMISVEMIDEFDIPTFTRTQKELNRRMQEIIEKPEYAGIGLKLDPTKIATDIQNGHVGKHFGAQRIITETDSKGIAIEHFIAIGDSASDAEMADELHSQGKSVEFVFVSDRDELNRDNLPYPVTFTDKKFGEGTLEFIKTQQEK